jgi:hypothetical protein
MVAPDGNWTGGGRTTNGPPLVAVVLRSVVETTVGTPDGAVGAYCRSSSVDGVRRTTVVTEDAFDDMVVGMPEELGV